MLEVKHSPEQLARMLSREVARSKTAQLRDRRGGLQSATGHHHAISKKNSNSPSVSYADFVNIMTDVLPGHAEVESTIEGGHHVGLPLRLMLSAFRRKKTLEVFMNNSSARARLAAKGQEQANRELYGAGSAEDGNGSATLGAEKRSSSSEHLAGLGGKGAGGMQTRAMNRTSRKLSHLHGMSMSDGGRQTSSAMYLGPGMRSGMHSSAAARRGAKSSSSSSLLASTSFTDGLGPSYLHIDNSSGSLPSATAGESRSLHTSGACVSERMPGVKASVSTPNLLPVVRAHTSYADRNSCLREASEATFIRAPRTANRTTRILKGRHDQMSSMSVSHLAWQQQQVLLSQVDRWSERQRGATQTSCSHFHKGNSVDGAEAAPPPIRLRDERPSTSYVIQEASRKLEEAHSSSFLSRSHQRPRGSDTVQAAGQHHQRGVVPATRYGATDRAGGGLVVDIHGGCRDRGDAAALAAALLRRRCGSGGPRAAMESI